MKLSSWDKRAQLPNYEKTNIMLPWKIVPMTYWHQHTNPNIGLVSHWKTLSNEKAKKDNNRLVIYHKVLLSLIHKLKGVVVLYHFMIGLVQNINNQEDNRMNMIIKWLNWIMYRYIDIKCYINNSHGYEEYPNHIYFKLLSSWCTLTNDHTPTLYILV